MQLVPYQIDDLLRSVAARPVTRASVSAFEDIIKSHPDAITPMEFNKGRLFHHFMPGVYLRELHIPADMITTGMIHKHPCLCILAKGKRRTLVNGALETVTAPHIQLTPAGFKRVSYTIEAAVFITVHENQTNSRDTAWLEKEISCSTEQDYQAFLAGRQ
jgi:hypothetical protein